MIQLLDEMAINAFNNLLMVISEGLFFQLLRYSLILFYFRTDGKKLVYLLHIVIRIQIICSS
jgi:hypothetical protein